jgi:hypothetical protein
LTDASKTVVVKDLLLLFKKQPRLRLSDDAIALSLGFENWDELIQKLPAVPRTSGNEIPSRGSSPIIQVQEEMSPDDIAAISAKYLGVRPSTQDPHAGKGITPPASGKIDMDAVHLMRKVLKTPPSGIMVIGPGWESAPPHFKRSILFLLTRRFSRTWKAG